MKKILITLLMASILLTACGQTTSKDSQVERPNSGSIHGLSESVAPSFLSE